MKLNNLILQILFIMFLFMCNSFFCIVQKDESNRTNYNEDYYIDKIDTNFFKDYIVYFIKTNDSKNKYLFSKKIKGVDSLYFFFNYQKILEKNSYKFKMNVVDTNIVTYSRKELSHIKAYLYNGELIWYMDTIRTKIYYSNDIIDNYLIIK